MLLNQGSNKRLRELSVSILLAVVFSQVGLLIFLFTVPLYTLYYRKGASDFLTSSGTVMFLVLIMALWKTRSVTDTDLRRALIVIEMMIPVLLMLGLFFVIDIIPVVSGFRRLYRLLLATAAAVIVFLPFYRVLKGNTVFIDAVGNQLNAMAGVLLGEGSASFESEVVKTYFGDEGFLEYLKNFYINSAAAIYFLILLVTNRISELVLFRLSGKLPVKLIDFKVPGLLLWPMLISAVLMIADMFELFQTGLLSPVIWNAGMILLFVYGLQGLAILRSLFIRYRVPPGLRLMAEFFIIMMLVVPGINYIVIIGLPVLGVSETWINLRKSIRST
jgi:hypothetical protein